MILRKAFSSREKKSTKPLDAVVTPNVAMPELVSTLGYVTGSGQSVTPENSKNIATAYRCGNIISDDVAKMPLQTFISRHTGEIDRMQPDGLLHNIAWIQEIQPNRWWSPFQFKKIAIQWLLYWGNAYIWQPPAFPREHFILPTNTTYPAFDATGNLWYITTFNGNTKATPIPAVEVMHLLINPDATGFVGRSVITFARETMGRQLSAYAMQNSLYKNGLSASGILWLAGESSPEIRSKVRAMYEEVMSGSDNAGRIAILDRKVSKFEPITLQPKDAQFLEGMGDNDAQIANFFGLPLHKINMGKQSYESNEQQNLDYLSTTLDPYLVQWEQAAALKWLTTQEQAYTYFRFERSSLFRTNARERGEYLNGAINNGRLTPNEARQVEDRTASDNPAADQLYMAANITPMGSKPTGVPNA